MKHKILVEIFDRGEGVDERIDSHLHGRTPLQAIVQRHDSCCVTQTSGNYTTRITMGVTGHRYICTMHMVSPTI
jgi:hypothetical protein